MAAASSVLEASKYAALGADRFSKQNYAAAIKFYQLAIQKNHKEFSFYLIVAECHIACEQFDLAIHNAQEAADLNSKSSRAFILAGRALCGAKKFEEAERNFIKARELTEESGDNTEPIDDQLKQLRTDYLKSLGFNDDVSKSCGKSSSSCKTALQLAINHKPGGEVNDVADSAQQQLSKPSTAQDQSKMQLTSALNNSTGESCHIDRTSQVETRISGDGGTQLTERERYCCIVSNLLVTLHGLFY